MSDFAGAKSVGSTDNQRAAIAAEVEAERRRQEAKFPDQHLPDGTSVARYTRHANKAKASTDMAAEFGDLSWRHVLTEEFFEALAEDDPAALRVELIQVAAVAQRWVEDIDSRNPAASPLPEGRADGRAIDPLLSAPMARMAALEDKAPTRQRRFVTAWEKVPVAAPALPEGRADGREFRSERLRGVIREALENGVAGCWCDDSDTDAIAETAAAAAEAWWLSVSLRTRPEFVQALIDADEFDWENAKPLDMAAFKARLEHLRPAPVVGEREERP